MTHPPTETLKARLRIPVIAAPLFIISVPALVVAQCTAGIAGAFPALNARLASRLDEWLAEITEALAAWDDAHADTSAAPFADNQIVHRSKDRLDDDLETCRKYRVPLVITSLGAPEDVNRAVADWGGATLHDVIDSRFARKAVEKGERAWSPWQREPAGMPDASRPLRWCRKFVPGSRGRLCCRARSRPAVRYWPRRRWARTSPILARPSDAAYKDCVVGARFGHHLFEPVYWRPRQPPAPVDRGCRARPRCAAAGGRIDDEFQR